MNRRSSWDMLLNGAAESIHVITYLPSDPRIMGALKDVAGRGVKTRLILERQPAGWIGNDEVQVSSESFGSGPRSSSVRRFRLR